MDRQELKTFGEVPTWGAEEEFNDLLCTTVGYSLRNDDPSLTNAILASADVTVSEEARVVGSDRGTIQEATRKPDCVIHDPTANRLIIIECKWNSSFSDADYYEQLQQRVEEDVDLIFISDTRRESVSDVPHVTFREINQSIEQTTTNCPGLRDQMTSKLDELNYAGGIELPTKSELNSLNEFVDILLKEVYENVASNSSYTLETEAKGNSFKTRKRYIQFEDNEMPRINLEFIIPGDTRMGYTSEGVGIAIGLRKEKEEQARIAPGELPSPDWEDMNNSHFNAQCLLNISNEYELSDITENMNDLMPRATRLIEEGLDAIYQQYNINS